MLVEYTPISSLNERELQALKGATVGLTLEGRGSHFVFAGKTFKMSELIAQQRVWESERRSVGQQLNG
jgi:hypothetical protein